MKNTPAFPKTNAEAPFQQLIGVVFFFCEHVSGSRLREDKIALFVASSNRRQKSGPVG